MTDVHVAPPRVKKMPLDQAIAMVSGRTPFAAAEHFDRQIGMWHPQLQSADVEVTRDARKVRARARDLYRNHPIARQIVRQAVHAVVGKKLRYASRLDHKFLGIDVEEAKRWGREFDRVWEQFAHGPGNHIDAGRRLNFTQKMRLALKARMVDGESLQSAEWAPDRKWKTCFQDIDVDRLDNPHGKPNTAHLRDGIIIDNFSAPIGYYIRNGHPADVGIDAAGRALTWSTAPRETSWGRPIILHSFQADRVGQTRGISEFTTVIRMMKMEGEFGEADLAAAIMHASYALVIKTSADYGEAMQALGMEVEVEIDPDTGQNYIKNNPLTDIQLHHLANMAGYYDGKQIGIGPGTATHLAPNDELQLVSPGNKGTGAPEFSKHAVRQYSAGLGGDPIAISQNYSDVNYSSARMSVATNQRGHDITRGDLASEIAMPQVRSFMEEVVFAGVLDLPRGVSKADFFDALPALARGQFLASGPPMLDPVKERQGHEKGWALGLDTLEELAAAEGDDWEEKVAQKAVEIAEMRRLGVPIPGEPVMPAMAENNTSTETNEDE